MERSFLDFRDTREIRLFISSTFSDMREERSYLMTKVFPKLRALAVERDVILSQIDLRWGVTDEEAKGGKVLEICLTELDNCIPFFIGIIGNHYGFCPNSDNTFISAIRKDHFSWVFDDMKHGLSVTEMEMQHGALRLEEASNACFFIKKNVDPIFEDNPTKTASLIETVRNNGRYPVIDFNNPAELGKEVENHFMVLLDTFFPIGEFSESDKMNLPHNNVVRVLTQSYVRNEDDFCALNSWLTESKERLMTVVGPSGIGKSALVCNWIMSLDKTKYNAIYHCVGKNDDGCGENIINRINSLIADDGRINVVIIDGLDRLRSVDSDLSWLDCIAPKCRILTSMGDCNKQSLIYLKERNSRLWDIKRLSAKYKLDLVQKELKRYGKIMTNSQIASIEQSSLCSLPVILKTLLYEVITCSEYETIDKDIVRYLNSVDETDFYIKVIERLEKNHNAEVIEYVLVWLYLSKYGVFEQDMIDIADIKPLVWSEVRSAILPFLSFHEGRMSIDNKYLLDAIGKKYLSSTKKDLEWRRSLVKAYTNSTRDNVEPSRAFNGVLESLYHLCYKKIDDERLIELLSVPSLFKLIFDRHRDKMISWFYCLNNRKFEVGKIADVGLLEEDAPYALDYYQRMISLCQYTGFRNVVVEFAKSALDFIDTNSNVDQSLAIDVYSTIFNALRHYQVYRKDEEDIFHRCVRAFLSYLNDADNSIQKADIFHVLGQYFSEEQGNYEEAMNLYRKEKEIREQLNDKINLDSCYNNIGEIYSDMGNYVLAYDYCKKALDIVISCKGEFNMDTPTILENLACFCEELGRIKEAISFCEKALAIRRSLTPDDLEGINLCEDELKILYSKDV